MKNFAALGDRINKWNPFGREGGAKNGERSELAKFCRPLLECAEKYGKKVTSIFKGSPGFQDLFFDSWLSQGFKGWCTLCGNTCRYGETGELITRPKAEKF